MGPERVRCHTSQEVCPWNVSFALEVREPAFAPRTVIGTKDARKLAEEVLAMDDDAYRAAFKGSAMKRAKLSGLQRNARVVLGTHNAQEREPAAS
jgi:epoxyqueuosine reductase